MEVFGGDLDGWMDRYFLIEILVTIKTKKKTQWF
jgi:hypothetical protein